MIFQGFLGMNLRSNPKILSQKNDTINTSKTSVKLPANSSATGPGREGTSGLCRKQLRGLVPICGQFTKGTLRFFYFTIHFGRSMILDDFEAWPHHPNQKSRARKTANLVFQHGNATRPIPPNPLL
jgi:hypothetical protein